MKVPSYPVGQTRPSSQGLSYLRPADTGQIVQAWSGVARGLAGIGAAFQEREDQDARFKALNAFNEFQIKIDEDLTNEKRDSQPGDSNFLDRAQTHYQNREDEFIAGLPADMQEEFKVRAGQVKQRVFGDSLDFQYKSQDLYYHLEIDKAYEASKNGLGLSGDPKQLDQWRKGLFEAIDESSLVPLEKEKLKHDMSLGLVGIAHQKDIENQISKGETAPGDYLGRLAQIESGGNANAKNPNSSAEGLFQITDATWKAYGGGPDRTNVAEQRRIAEAIAADAAKELTPVLGRPPTQGELYLAHQQGIGGAKKLLSNPNALAVDVVGYKEVVNNGGAPGMTAGQFAQKWIGKFEGTEPSDKIFASVNADPAYADLPYETRIAHQQDAMASVARANSARAAAEKEAHEAFMNTTLLGIHDNQVNRSDIDQLYAEGKIKDYGDLTKLENAIDERDKDEMNLLRAREKYNSSAIYNPNSDEDRKGLDLIVGEVGLASLSKGDQKYFKEQFLPIIDRANDVPTSAAGLLIGMSRSANQQTMMFALDAMAQIRDASEAAFNQRFGPQETADVNLFDSHKGLYTQEELFNIIRGGVTQEARQRNEALRTEGEKIVADPKRAPNFVDVLEAADVSFLPGTVPGVYAPAGAKMVAQNEFNILFVDEYARTGDIALATSNATKVMMRNWGVTNVGGQNLFMKFPPEKVGVPMFEGSYDWADKQLRDKLKLPVGEAYQLFSDDVTQSEWDQYRQGKGPSPSYKVITWKDGVPAVAEGPRKVILPTTGLLTAGNVDLAKRPIVKNADGSISTVRSMSFEENGQEILVPTVSPDGKLLSNKEAIALYRSTGQHLGKFDVAEHATQYAQALHLQQEQQFSTFTGRIRFEPTAALIQREEAIGDLKLLIGERDRFLTDVYSKEFARSQDRMQSGLAAEPIDPEIQRAMDELNARVEEREQQVYPEVPRKIPDYSIRNKPTFGVKP
jgi:hypothetical protein